MVARRCAECRGRNVKVEIRPDTFNYGLDNPVAIDDGVHIVCSDCGEVSVAMHPAKTQNAIASAIASSGVRLSPKEICYLRKFLSMNQSKLGERIGLSQEHLSRCETGKMVLGQAAERLLRLIAVAEAEGQSGLVFRALGSDSLKTLPPEEHHVRISVPWLSTETGGSLT